MDEHKYLEKSLIKYSCFNMLYESTKGLHNRKLKIYEKMIGEDN